MLRMSGNIQYFQLIKQDRRKKMKYFIIFNYSGRIFRKRRKHFIIFNFSDGLLRKEMKYSIILRINDEIFHHF
jgi:hypothetical protein